MAFDRENVRVFLEDVNAELAALASRYGLQVEQHGGNFNPQRLKVRFEFAEENGEGAPSDFASMAEKLGLPPDCWGKKFLCGKTTYTVNSLHLRRRKYPVLGIGPRGGKYKFTVEQVKNGLVA